MIVERNKNEIVVRFETGKNASLIQTILNYLKFEEPTSKSAATQKNVNQLTLMIRFL
jgi:hypothetical protein